MKYDFIIFGGTGFQGKICASDLLEQGYSTLLVGRDPSMIKDLLKNPKASFLKLNLNDENKIAEAIKKSKADVVINCSEYYYNIPILKACLKTKKPCTDLGGSKKGTGEAFVLDKNFKKSGIIGITGCGSTPGISNVMTAYGIKDFDCINEIFLGFAWDSNIKKFFPPYSMNTIFEELTESPDLLENGRIVKAGPFKCSGTFNFKAVGRQTTYCMGHSEVYTYPKYFKKYGLKHLHYMAGFPEHSLKVINTLINLGFNSREPMNINGQEILPVDFTTRILKKIPIPKGYTEVENIWVRIKGMKNGKKKETKMECIVRTLKGWEYAGSNIDTGRTIAIISKMIKEGKIKEKGVYGPEAIIPQEDFFSELAKRKMYVYHNGKKIN